MNTRQHLKLLFVLNSRSGTGDIDYPSIITQYCARLSHTAELFELPESCVPDDISQKIRDTAPDRVVAVGGDGTVKLVAGCLLESGIPLAILPAGSANGMAKELGIPVDTERALDVVTGGIAKKIHAVSINGELCIHLSDIGYNAFVVKKFEAAEKRGMWGYTKAAWHVLWNHDKMEVSIQIDDRYITRKASMIVIANATKYGTGVLINPEGKLDDDLFEVIAVKKISLAEIFKMRVTHMAYNPRKTELFHTRSLQMSSSRKVHFQVDGEYLGKVNKIEATILPAAITMVVPAEMAQ